MIGVYPPAFRTGDQQTQDFTVAGGLQVLAAQGADMSKVAVGAAMYGRGWTGVSGFAAGASPLTGSGTGPVAGSWEPGVVDYKDIAVFENDPAWVKGYDEVAQARISISKAAVI
ncbi:MAG: chitinase [Alteromonadaceae bacterium]|jgi:chitinase